MAAPVFNRSTHLGRPRNTHSSITSWRRTPARYARAVRPLRPLALGIRQHANHMRLTSWGRRTVRHFDHRAKSLTLLSSGAHGQVVMFCSPARQADPYPTKSALIRRSAPLAIVSPPTGNERIPTDRRVVDTAKSAGLRALDVVVSVRHGVTQILDAARGRPRSLRVRAQQPARNDAGGRGSHR